MVKTIIATLHDRKDQGRKDEHMILAKVEIDRTSICISLLGDTINDVEADVFIEYNHGVVRAYIWDHKNVNMMAPIATIPLIERR